MSVLRASSAMTTLQILALDVAAIINLLGMKTTSILAHLSSWGMHFRGDKTSGRKDSIDEGENAAEVVDEG